MEEEGFWIRYWNNKSYSNEDYKYYPYSDGWKKEDKDKEEMWRKEAEAWAENKGCWAYNSFEYGFEFVDKPPKEWLDKKISRLESSLIFYKQWVD